MSGIANTSRLQATDIPTQALVSARRPKSEAAGKDSGPMQEGLDALHEGDLASAQDFFVRAQHASPHSCAPWAGQALVAMRQTSPGSLRLAEAHLERAMAAEDGITAEALFAQGLLALEMGHLSVVVGAAARIWRTPQGPSDRGVMGVLLGAWSAHVMGRRDEAIDWVQRGQALKLSSGWFDFVAACIGATAPQDSLLGLKHQNSMRQQNLRHAGKHYTELARAACAPSGPEALVRLNGMAQSSEPSSDIQVVVVKLQAIFRCGGDISSLSDFLTERPDSFELRQLALLRARRERDNTNILDHVEFLATRMDTAEAWAALALDRIEQRLASDVVRQALNQALTRQIDQPLALLVQGRLLLKEQRCAQALGLFEACLDHGPDFVDALHYAAQCKQQLRQHAQAILFWDDYLVPENASRLLADAAWFGRGQSKAALNDADGASSDLAHVARNSPFYEDATALASDMRERRFEIGCGIVRGMPLKEIDVLIAKGDLRLALDNVQHQLSTVGNTNNVPLIERRCEIHMKMGRITEAHNDARRAIDLSGCLRRSAWRAEQVMAELHAINNGTPWGLVMRVGRALKLVGPS